MAKRPPKKNAVEWHTIEVLDEDEMNLVPEDFREIQIGIKHVGAHTVRGWALELSRIYAKERKRQKDAGDPIAERSESYEKALNQIVIADGGPADLKRIAEEALADNIRPMSPEFGEEIATFYEKALKKVVTGVRGLTDGKEGEEEPVPDDEQEPALEFIEWMGPEYENAVYAKAQEVQSLTLRQRFRASGSRK